MTPGFVPFVVLSLMIPAFAAAIDIPPQPVRMPPGAGVSNALPDPPLSIMGLEWNRRLDGPWNRVPTVRIASSDGRVNNDDLIVFGYLPYWTIDDATLRLDLLTHIAYFAVAVNADGSLGDSRHWGTTTMDEVIAAAHSEGVKVVLTATAFSSSLMETLLSSPSARATAVSNLVELVSLADGDGVNIDFEGVPVSVKSQFVEFIVDLKAAMDAALGESSVTLAMPAVDWRGAYDFDLLAEASDGLFLMEYDFHYSGGHPGPVSPLDGSTLWGKYSVTWSLDDYDTYGGENNRHKFVLGLPLYGFDWPAEQTEPPSPGTGDATAVSFIQCQQRGATNGWNWDPYSATPWYDYFSDGQYRQVWCETPESLEMLLALARERGLGGVGFWALGYEGQRTEPWDSIVTLWDLDGQVDTGDTTVPEIVEEVRDSGPAADAATDSFEQVGDTFTISDEVAADAFVASDNASDSYVFNDIAVDRATAADEGSGLDIDDLAADGSAVNRDEPAGDDPGGCSSSPAPRASLPFLLVVLVPLIFLRSIPIVMRRS